MNLVPALKRRLQDSVVEDFLRVHTETQFHLMEGQSHFLLDYQEVPVPVPKDRLRFPPDLESHRPDHHKAWFHQELQDPDNQKDQAYHHHLQRHHVEVARSEVVMEQAYQCNQVIHQDLLMALILIPHSKRQSLTNDQPSSAANKE